MIRFEREREGLRIRLEGEAGVRLSVRFPCKGDHLHDMCQRRNRIRGVGSSIVRAAVIVNFAHDAGETHDGA